MPGRRSACYNPAMRAFPTGSLLGLALDWLLVHSAPHVGVCHVLLEVHADRLAVRQFLAGRLGAAQSAGPQADFECNNHPQGYRIAVLADERVTLEVEQELLDLLLGRRTLAGPCGLLD